MKLTPHLLENKRPGQHDTRCAGAAICSSDNPNPNPFNPNPNPNPFNPRYRTLAHLRESQQTPSLVAGLRADGAVRIQRECCLQVRHGPLR